MGKVEVRPEDGGPSVSGNAGGDKIQLGADETVVFSYIVYESCEQRDLINAKIMKDPGIQQMCDPDNPPFDCKRRAYGGFTVLVQVRRECAGI